MANLLGKVGRSPKTCSAQIDTFCHGGAAVTPGGKTIIDGGRGERTDNSGGRGSTVTVSSTASLAEILAYFGFVFEGTGKAVKPSVAETFAMLRLHAQPAEVRVAGETTRRFTTTYLL